MGNIFKIQRFSLHDGPGIRTTVFLKGCPLRCSWCCNPESQHAGIDVFFYKRLCIACGACKAVCTENAIGPGYEIDRARCTQCGMCAEVCLVGAKEIAGRKMSIAEVMSIVERDKIFYDKSGGGVTLCGGEPLIQKKFVLDFLDSLRNNGISSAMETSACVAVLPDIARRCDLILFDLKTLNERKGKDALGFDVSKAVCSLRKILDAGSRVILRYAVIPGFNDSEGDIDAFIRLAQSVPIQEVNLLPFHRLADGKYAALGRTYDYADVPTLAKAELSGFSQRFSDAGIKVSIAA